MPEDIKIIQSDKISAEVSKQLDERLASQTHSGDIRDLRDNSETRTPKHDELFDSVVKTFCRNGYTRDINAQDFVNNPNLRNDYKISYDELVDLIDTIGPKADKDYGLMYDNVGLNTNAGILIPRVINQIVRESVDPIMIGTSLLRKISYSNGETLTFPAVGMYNAADISPGQEYPEKSLDYAGVVHAKIGKAGVKIRITDEMIRYSMFDVMALHLRAAARAMVRHKEEKIFNMITNQGTTIFDNAGGTSLRGQTAGRDRTGNVNYTLTLDDLFTSYADLMNAGFVPTTLLMSPMGWLVFVLSGTLRSYGFHNNGPLWGKSSGAPGKAPNWGGMGPSSGRVPSTTPTEMSNSNLKGEVPSLFPAPLEVVVSPFMQYSSSCQTTTITMCDRNELGFLIEDEPLVTESWDDPKRDIMSTKFRERYAVAVDNQGRSIANMKGIAIAKGYDYEDFQVTRSIGTGILPDSTGVNCET